MIADTMTDAAAVMRRFRRHLLCRRDEGEVAIICALRPGFYWWESVLDYGGDRHREALHLYMNYYVVRSHR